MKETKDKTDDDKSKDDLPESHQRDEESMLMKWVLKVNLIRLETDETGTVIMTKDLLEKLKSPNNGYDSDETIMYYPGREVKLKKPKLLGEECGKLMPTVAKWLIRAHPLKAGFQISLHGIRQKKKRTYIGCRIPGCKLRFPSVREWNSHHRLIHKGFHLSCDKCKKSFNTLSFLRDHAYLHSKVSFKCERCDKTFAFKSLYKIHVCTHLKSRIHKCFAGSCGWEYKWLQDQHHHIQSHLKWTYGCNICNYSNPQEYLLKRYFKKHNDRMYCHCDFCGYECKWYTQLSRHTKECSM